MVGSAWMLQHIVDETLYDSIWPPFKPVEAVLSFHTVLDAPKNSFNQNNN